MIEHMQNRPIDITVIWSFVYLFFPLYELIYVSMESIRLIYGNKWRWPSEEKMRFRMMRF